MRTLMGIILVLLGCSVGTYAMLSGRDTTGAHASPPFRLSAIALVPAAAVSEPPAAPRVVPPPAAAAAVDPPKAIRLAEIPPRVPVALDAPSSGPPDPLTLTLEIQRELRRVGCYQGAINGVWSPAVSHSMQAFTDHVNAVLPVAQPDVILLALLQGHHGKVCRASCPAGQTLAENRRCLPHALVAPAAKRKPAPDPELVKTPAPAPRVAVGPSGGEPPPMKRMSLGASSLASASTSPPTPRKRSARHLAYPGVRARREWQPAVSPYHRYPRWAARAFANP